MEQIKHGVIKLGGGRHLGVARAGAGDAEEEDGGEGEGERGGAGVAVPPVQPADGVPAAGLVPPHGDRPDRAGARRRRRLQVHHHRVRVVQPPPPHRLPRRRRHEANPDLEEGEVDADAPALLVVGGDDDGGGERRGGGEKPERDVDGDVGGGGDRHRLLRFELHHPRRSINVRTSSSINN